MNIKILNTEFEKYYKVREKVQATPLPDGTYFITEHSYEHERNPGIKTDLATLYDRDSQYLDLPEMGEPCTKGVVYVRPLPDATPDSMENPLVICQQDHNRTEHDVTTIPALFTFFRTNSDDLEWIPNELVKTGWKRWHDGVQYEQIQPAAILTVIGQTPDLVPALWERVQQQGEPWVQPTGTVGLYNTGDIVTHNGYTWESTINNNSWAPGVYGWTKL